MNQVPSEWKEPIAQIISKARTVMLVGGTDTGKTTFCTYLAAEALQQGRRVAVVDADIGQSEIGPPGCIGLGMPMQVPFRLSELKPRGLHFIGSTSPPGFLVECVTGVVRMTQRARSLGADFIVVDTTGLVRGYLGRKLKAAKFDALQPDIVAHLERPDEPENATSVFPPSKLLCIPVPDQVRIKTQEIRALRRRAKLASYFREAREMDLQLDKLIRRGTHLLTGRPIEPAELQSLGRGLSSQLIYGELIRDWYYFISRGPAGEADIRTLAQRLNTEQFRLVNVARLIWLSTGLLDEEANTLAMGLVVHIDLSTFRLRVITPWLDAESVHGVSFGVMRAQPDGIELEPLKRGEI